MRAMMTAMVFVSFSLLPAETTLAAETDWEATEWLPHTTRAALTGLRKRGFSIERTREEGADSIGRIIPAPDATAA